MTTVRRLLQFLRPLAPMMTASATLRVLNQGLGVALPALGAVAVVRAVTGGDAGPVVWLLVAAAVVKGGCRYLEQFTGHHVAFRLLSLLRTEFYRKVEPLAPGALAGARTGDLVSRVTADVDRVEPFYAHTIAPLVSAVVVPAAGLVAVGMIHPDLALALAPFLVVGLVVVPVLGWRRSLRLGGELREGSGRLGAELTDGIQGVRDVLAFDDGERRLAALAAHGEEQAARRGARGWIAGVRSGLSELVAAGGLVAVTVVAAGLLASGVIDPAGTAVAVAVAFGIFTPVRALEELVPDLDESLSAAERLFDLMDRRPAVEDPASPEPASGRGGVEVDRVTFTHPTRRVPALVDATVAVGEGETVAVVGPSGSGKSTLISLLLRWWDPDAGSVRVGGVDVRRLSQDDLRAQLAVATQRPHLFLGSIADNVRLGAPDVADAEIDRLCRRLGLGPLLDAAPAGIHTPVGELGGGLSGGQRQRVALARALVRDAPVLVLDEATSELDVDTERQVLETVRQRAAGRSVIVVAHRLHTITDADRIVVLDRGRVVEQGTHPELVAAGGVYAGLWQREHDALAEAGA